MPERGFTRSIGAALSGLLIWAAHFLFAYIFTALACARRFDGMAVFGVGIVPFVVGSATIIAAAALVVIFLATLRPGPAVTDSALFLRRLTAIGAGLSLVAVIWAGLPLLMVPACG